MPRARVTKRVQFSAGHRLRCTEFSEEENRRVFGDCYNPHGHNYDLEVTVKGEIDPKTGFVIELGALKQRLKELVVSEMDHQDLNDVPLMAGLNPTVENMVVQIWRRLEGHLDPLTLVSVKLWETERNIAEYRGE